MMDRSLLSMLLGLFLFILFTNCQDILQVCTSTNTAKTDIDLTDDWYDWGAFYSYCMQISGSDLQCEKTACKSCIKACYMSLDNIQSKTICDSQCQNDDYCKQGCSFYLGLLGKPGAVKPTQDSAKLPNANNAVFSTVEKAFTNITYGWTAQEQANIPTVYLITLTTKDLSRPSSALIQEKVLGLTTKLNYLLTEIVLCNNKGVIFNRILQFEVALNVASMNLHGKNNFISSQSSEMKKVPKPTDVTVSDPSYRIFVNAPEIVWTVTWKYPIDKEYQRLVTKMKIFWMIDSCTNKQNQRKMETVTASERFISPDSTTYQIRVSNTEQDDLATCTIKLQVTPSLDPCLVGEEAEEKILYKGCEDVANYPTNTCNPVTTPKPTDLPTTGITAKQSSISCTEFDVVICAANTTTSDCPSCISYTVFNATHYNCTECKKGLANIDVGWVAPLTGTPIKNYIVYYGEPNAIFTSKVTVGNSTIIPTTQTTSTLYNITVPGYIGVTVYSETSTPGVWFTPLSYNYVFINLTLPNDLTIAPTSAPTTTQPTPNPLPATGGKGTDAGLVAGVIVAIILVLVLLVLFLFWRKRNNEKRRQHSSPFVNDEMKNYMTTNASIVTDEWEIFPENITLDEKIGEGAFGTVFSANIEAKILIKSKYSKLQGGAASLLSDKNGRVAVKLLKEGAGQEEFEDFREEITLMKSIGYHKNIVNLIGCSTINKPLCLIVEFLPYGDLLHYLRKRRSKLIVTTTEGESSNAQGFMYTQDYQDTLQTSHTTLNSKSNLVPEVLSLSSVGDEEILTPDDLISIAWQIASGMEFLAANNMVHRDLAARNILVGHDKIVKISDFGLTRRMSTDKIYMSNKSRRLPVKWMSVEAIFLEKFTTASDVWAYGVVLFEIVTLGGSPYPSVNNRELLGMLKSGYRMDKPDNCAEAMYDIMLHCWNEDPEQRPSFTELREHLENIISDGDKYFSFEINEENTYYNVASFKSVQDESEDEELLNEVLKNRLQNNEIEANSDDEEKLSDKESDDEETKEIKEEDKKLEEKVKKLESEDPFENEDKNRYTTPHSLKSDEEKLKKLQDGMTNNINDRYIKPPSLKNHDPSNEQFDVYINDRDNNLTTVL